MQITKRLPPIIDYEREVVANVEQFGWHCTHVSPTDKSSSPLPFTYSVGLYASYQQPEFLVIGLDRSRAQAIITDLAGFARSGNMIPLDRPSDALPGGLSCAFITVPRKRYNDYVFSALWYYAEVEFPLYQAVWPDDSGCYPWNKDGPADFLTRQPVLALDE